MADERPRGVHLSDKQLVFLFMSATGIAVVVFLCGVLVGRGVRTARGPLTDAGSIAASQVVGDSSPVETPAADGVPRQGTNTQAATGTEPYTYPDRLGKHPPAEKLKVPQPTQETAAREAVPPPEVPAEPVAKPKDAAPAGGTLVRRAAAVPGAAGSPPKSIPATALNAPSKPNAKPEFKPEVKPQASRPSSTPAASAVAPPVASNPTVAPSPSDYTVQVAAVKSREEADSRVTRLKSKGYDAYVSVAGKSRPGVFRVRVGAFKEKRDAEALAQRLAHEGYDPWVTR
jgi:DedD protein